jgi:protein phosphatase
MNLDVASASHPGLVRRTNEDSLASRVPHDSTLSDRRGALFSIADGVGGESAGEVASRAAVDAVVTEYYSPRAPHRIETALGQAVQAANRRVFDLAHGPDPALFGMQTTLSAFVLAGRQGYVAHVGDTRIYRYRGRVLTQLTGDHSEAADLLRLRLISAEQAREHPRRGVLTRTVGQSPVLRPDFARIDVEPGDGFLLCTDGLWSEVEDEQLARELDRSPREACRALVQLACDAGGGDNVSVLVVRVLDVGPEPERVPAGRIARLLSGLRGG